MQVAKWGNSLAVRLPASVVDALELREGDDIEIVVDSPRVFAVSRKPQAEARRDSGATTAFQGQVARGFQVQPGRYE
nr:AbrB/MazE/SpoVT family DNA-binding domain-containing protein [Burkholderia sp. MSMB1459WGS]